MSKRVPKLCFTEEELQDTATKKAAEKSEKAVKKLEKAEKKIPKKMFHEDIDKPKPSSKLSSDIKKAPIKAASSYAHKRISENGDENVGIESVHKAEQAIERTAEAVRTVERHRKLKPYRDADRFERKADKANIEALYQKSDNKQKQAIKKEYARMKSAHTENMRSPTHSAAFSKAAEKGKEVTAKIKDIVAEHKTGTIIAGGMVIAALLIFGMLSSGTVLLESGIGGIGLTTYPSSDEAMLQAESDYSNLESNLSQMISTYESTHTYDEYHIIDDEISHDPYVLISCLTALKGGEWTAEDVESDIRILFNLQYTITENVVTEVRQREETKYRVEWYIDENGYPIPQIIPYTEQAEYNYYICYVTVGNNDLENVVCDVLSSEQYEIYEMYKTFSGNRPDLFPDYAENN